MRTLFEALVLVVLVVNPVFCRPGVPRFIPDRRGAGLAGRHLRRDEAARLFHQRALLVRHWCWRFGIVVDDAIVVVENVERNIELGLSPRDATRRAMEEVSGPIIAIALVLCAVFIPDRLHPGLDRPILSPVRAHDRDFQRSFRRSIRSTLSPALAAVLLRGHDVPKDLPTRFLDRSLGWLFRPFNRFFDAAANGYVGLVRKLLRRSGFALVAYAGLLGLTYFGFAKVPTGFVPHARQAVPGRVRAAAGCRLTRSLGRRDPSHVEARAGDRRCGTRDRISRPLDRGPEQHAQRRHRVRRTEVVRMSASPRTCTVRRSPPL